MNPQCNNNENISDNVNKNDNQVNNTQVPPDYYSFPTFANSTNNLNLGYVNESNIIIPINRSASNLDSYNPSATNRINASMTRSSSQFNKDELINQNNNQNNNYYTYNNNDNNILPTSITSIPPSNMKNSKSLNNFNNYINNKVSSIKEFTKKNIIQLQNRINSSTSIENIQNTDNEALLPKDKNVSYGSINNLSENEDITDDPISPTTNVYPNNSNVTSFSAGNNENTIENNNNAVNSNNNSGKDIKQKQSHHILRKNTIEESFSDFQNTIFNSDQYSPEYDFLIQLLSVPNDNLIIKHAIQHRISYLQEYIDETRRYTQLSRNSKLKKSIVIQAITFVITLFIIFKSSFFFIEVDFDPSNNNDNDNSSLKLDLNKTYYDEKIYLLKLLGIILLFYNELIFVQNSLLSVHSIAIGNIDIIFGNHDNNRIYSSEQISNNEQNKENRTKPPLPLLPHNQRSSGSTKNCNKTYEENDKDNILYSVSTTDNSQKKINEKNYFTQEKAFYSRNNISVNLKFSINSLNDDINSSFINLSYKKMNNTDNNNNNNMKTNEMNNLPSLNDEANNNNLNSKQNLLQNDLINNKNINNNNSYKGDNENMTYLSNIPNNRSYNNGNENYYNNNINNNYQNQSTSNPNIYSNQSNEDDTNSHSLKCFFKRHTNKCYNLYNKFLNRFIKNKNNYYEEIKKTLYIATCQGLIWGLIFSLIGYFYSDQQIIYSLLTFSSFVVSSILMSLISSINPVMVKLIQISDPIFVVGPFEILVQISLSILTYKIGMRLL